MSIANALGEIFRRELDAQLVPLQEAVRRMEESLEALELLRTVTHRLAPLTSRLGSLAGVRPDTAALESPRARAGRKPAAPATRSRASGVKAAEVRPVGGRARVEEGSRACAVIGCDRPSRSKGYCSAHYQKLRLLMRTNRRPTAWTDDAAPQSVDDVTLPRGRAASKALREGGVSEESAPAPVARQASAAKQAPAAKKGAAAKKAPAAKKTSTAKKAPAAKKAASAKKAPAAKKAAPAKKAAGARKGAAAKKASAKAGRKVKATNAKAGKRKKAGRSSAQGSLF